MSAADRVVTTGSQSTGCGTRYEELTADDQVHVACAPPLEDPWFEGDDDPDYNPICGCPRVPASSAGSALARTSGPRSRAQADPPEAQRVRSLVPTQVAA
ncbi:hypothetical protein [Streptomyces hydrogenans]|uniref:hypothetical protein n=1 Tax=Streptomyces hydrogenans TaxID=1873719 RepID=UPI003D71498C